MSKQPPITLSDRQLAYAHQKVESGQFGSVDDVVHDALRRAEEHDLRIEHLRELIREGEESGIAEGFDWDTFMAEQFPNA